jgi:hypothetical protein
MNKLERFIISHFVLPYLAYKLLYMSLWARSTQKAHMDLSRSRVCCEIVWPEPLNVRRLRPVAITLWEECSLTSGTELHVCCCCCWVEAATAAAAAAATTECCSNSSVDCSLLVCGRCEEIKRMFSTIFGCN